MKVHTLAELKAFKRAMAERAAAEAARREAERLAALRREREHRLFELAVGPVRPIAHPGRIEPRPVPVDPVPVQRLRDEASVMREALSDEFDIETLLHTDELLSYRRPGLGPEIVRKLRGRPLEHPAPDRPAWPAHRRSPRGAGPFHPGSPSGRPALRARGCTARAWAHPAAPRC